jgi:hypothetical protein
MALAQVCLAVLLISRCCSVQASPTESNSKRDATHSSATQGGSPGSGDEAQASPLKYDTHETNVTWNQTKGPERTVIPFEDIAASLDANTFAHLSNVQLSTPVDVDLANINPDFSRMILNVDTRIESMDIEGDYRLLTKNFAILPFVSQGHFYISLHNVTVKGTSALALTPAALLAIDSGFMYTPQAVAATVVPISEITSPEEVYLSKDIVSGTLAEMIAKRIQENLNYYVDAQINVALSRISVFTVGHRHVQSANEGQPTQNVKIGDLFDELLADVKAGIWADQEDKIDIPSFHRNFSEKLESDIINGTFSAEQGWLGGLSTLKRSSNVTLSKSRQEFILSAMLEFEDLRMGYDKYAAVFLNSNVKGELDGNFIHRQMTIKVALDPKEDGTCVSTLNELRIFKVNGYRIKQITNIGSFDWLHVRINNWLIGHFQTKIAKDVAKAISTAVRNSLSRFDCGEYLPSLKILV